MDVTLDWGRRAGRLSQSFRVGHHRGTSLVVVGDCGDFNWGSTRADIFTLKDVGGTGTSFFRDLFIVYSIFATTGQQSLIFYFDIVTKVYVGYRSTRNPGYFLY